VGARRREDPRETWIAWLAGGRLYLVLGALALTIAALSLLIPSTPSYDPWAWLVWGREIVHLKLQTTGGPTWKPLPVLFTTVFALFGKAAPDLWLIVARAGALVCAALVFKVSARITAGITGRRWSSGPVLLAAVIAAGSVIVSRGFISDNALGYSEGLMTALVLIALDRHLDGQRRQAFVVGFFAALDRPELWLAWGPYGLWLFWKDVGARRLVIGLFVLIPILWFLPEYWGSGHFLRGVNRAQHPRSNSPAFAKCPFCTEFVHHAWPTLLLRVKVVAGIAMAVAAFGLWRRRRLQVARVTLIGAGLAGLGWWVLIGVLTQAGFSGNDRYLVLGAALVAIAGGVGWGWAADLVARILASASRMRGFAWVRPIVASGAGVVAAAALFMALPPWIGANVVDIPATHRALVYQAHLREDMTAAVSRLGGPGRVRACGTVMTEGFQVPMLAWTLGVHTLTVQASPLSLTQLPPAPNVIFQTRAQRNSHLLPVVRAWKGVSYREVAHVRTFRVFEQGCRA
jgi:hypothetical protein